MDLFWLPQMEAGRVDSPDDDNDDDQNNVDVDVDHDTIDEKDISNDDLPLPTIRIHHFQLPIMMTLAMTMTMTIYTSRLLIMIMMISTMIMTMKMTCLSLLSGSTISNLLRSTHATVPTHIPDHTNIGHKYLYRAQSKDKDKTINKTYQPVQAGHIVLTHSSIIQTKQR